jgi:hypothetical protein
MASNSIAPSPRAVDFYLDGSDWKVDLWSADGSAQIAASTATTVGTVEVGVGGIVTLPLDLRAFGGDAAKELRVFGSGSIMLRLASAASSDFPVSSHTLVAGEVLAEQVEEIVDVSGLTRIRVSWGK